MITCIAYIYIIHDVHCVNYRILIEIMLENYDKKK